MPALRPFEFEAICLMSDVILSDTQLQSIRDINTVDDYEYTGHGYFLTIELASLPIDQRTLSEPATVGEVGDIRAGFVVFLGNRKLTLECHTWGAVDVPADFRDRDVLISTPPITMVNHDKNGDARFRSKFRNWINRDDGRLYQAGNTDLKWYAIVGYLSLVVAVGFFGIPQSIQLGYRPISIIFLVIAVALLIAGAMNRFPR